MKITSSQVKEIAALARLGLSDDEADAAARDIDLILNHFSLIQDIDTKDVPTYDNATGLTNIDRPDEAHSEVLCSCQTLLDLAPAAEQGQVRVPAVFN